MCFRLSHPSEEAEGSAKAWKICTVERKTFDSLEFVMPMFMMALSWNACAVYKNFKSDAHEYILAGDKNCPQKHYESWLNYLTKVALTKIFTIQSLEIN